VLENCVFPVLFLQRALQDVNPYFDLAAAAEADAARFALSLFFWSACFSSALYTPEFSLLHVLSLTAPFSRPYFHISMAVGESTLLALEQ
jgi:hypothetical protein